MAVPKCNENWHVFKGGLPKAGDICKCGKMKATNKPGILEAVKT